jgi:hypothetical protein
MYRPLYCKWMYHHCEQEFELFDNWCTIDKGPQYSYGYSSCKSWSETLADCLTWWPQYILQDRLRQTMPTSHIKHHTLWSSGHNNSHHTSALTVHGNPSSCHNSTTACHSSTPDRHSIIAVSRNSSSVCQCLSENCEERDNSDLGEGSALYGNSEQAEGSAVYRSSEQFASAAGNGFTVSYSRV